VNVARNGKKQRETGWLSRMELCRVFDITGSAFDRHIRTLVSSDHVRGAGKTLRFYGRAIVEAWATAQRRETDGDPLLSGTTTPALERYRDERAKLAKLDRLERERDLLKRHEVHEMLSRVASILRGAGEVLQREYGAQAHKILDEALDDAEREIARRFDA